MSQDGALGAQAPAAVPAPRAPGGVAGSDEEARLVRALRAGDERAFAALVDALSPGLLRVAQGHVPTRAVAEEVVQETWLALIERLGTFEERSSIKTWLYRVVVNVARTRGGRERRTTPFSDLVPADAEADEGPTVDPSRFLGAEARLPGHWAHPPQRWEESPERRLETDETLDLVREAIEQLPPRERVVVTLRDVQGFSADEVCELLSVSPGNQRVLLHRGRAQVRQALEIYLDGVS